MIIRSPTFRKTMLVCVCDGMEENVACGVGLEFRCRIDLYFLHCNRTKMDPHAHEKSNY